MSKRIWIGIVLAVAAVAAQAEIRTAGALLVNLDASALSGLNNNDKVTAWANAGTLGGSFLPAMSGQGPLLSASVGGVRAVTFAGSANSVMTNTVIPPATICGADTWSLEVWVFNPALGSMEDVFAWTGRNAWPGGSAPGSCMEFRYGIEAASAVEHNANNVAWNTLPPANAWHHFACTRDALGVERLFADGKLWTVSTPLLVRIRQDSSFTLGGVRDFAYTNSASAWIYPFSGSLARLRIHADALNSADVMANYLAEHGAFGLSDAADAVWQGSPDAALPWASAANWSGGAVPGAGDRVVIDNGGTAVVNSAAGTVARFFPVRGGLVMSNSASLTVPSTAGLHVVMGQQLSNTFNFALASGTFSMPGNNTHHLYFGQNGGCANAVIGGGAQPAVLDVDKDIYVGSGSNTVSRVRVESGAEVYSTYGYLYVANGLGSDGLLTVNGGLVSYRKSGQNMVVSVNGGKGVLVINGGRVTPSQDLVWATGTGYPISYGAVFLNGGEVSARRLYANTTVGTNLLYLNGGTLRNYDSRADFLQSLSGAYVKSGGAVFEILANTAVEVVQPLLVDPLSAGGGLTKNGGGSLSLRGTNTFTGDITVNAGDLWLRNAGGLAAGYSGTIQVNNGASVGYEKAGGVATLLSRLSASSAGSLILFSTNAAESVNFSSYPGMGIGFYSNVTYTGTYTPYNRQYVFAPMATNNVYAQVIGDGAGAASVTLNGGPDGTLELTAGNGYTGGTTINGGTLVMSHANALGDPATVTVPDIGIYNGGSLKLNDASIPDTVLQRIKPDSKGHLILGAAWSNRNVNVSSLPGIIVGTDQGTMNYTGTLTPCGNVYRMGGGRVVYTTTGQGMVLSNLTDGTGPLTLVIEGIGMVRPAAGNTYSGGTVVTNSGALHLREDSGLGAVPASPDPDNLYVSGGILRRGAAHFTLHANRGIKVGPDGMTLCPWDGYTTTALGDLSGSGAITNMQTGYIWFGGTSNTWGGTLSVNSGTVGPGSGGTFSWNSNAVISAAVGGSGNFGVNNNMDLTWSERFARPLGDVPPSFFYPAGSGANIGFRKLGSGSLMVDVSPSYTRDTVVESGTIKAGSDAPVPFGAGKGNLQLLNQNYNPVAQLDVNGHNVILNGLTGAGRVTNSAATSATLTVGSNSVVSTYNGKMAPNLTLVKTGTNTLTLFKGAEIKDLVLEQGRVVVGPAAAVTGTVSLAANVMLVIGMHTNETSGLLGEYFDFSNTALRWITETSNFVSLARLTAVLAPYAPGVITNSSPLGAGFDFGSAGAGFQGGYATKDYWVGRWTGRFLAEAGGVYAFATASDDGSLVFVDGLMVVTNNYSQSYSTTTGKRGGAIALTAGWHDFQVVFFDKSTSNGLTVWMTPPGGAEAVLPQNLLRPPAVRLGGLSGTDGASVSFLSANAALSLMTDGERIFDGQLYGTNALQSIQLSGGGKQTLKRVRFDGSTDVREGVLALQGATGIDGAVATISGAVTVSEGGTLMVRSYTPAWPNQGACGFYYNNAGFNGSTFTSLTAIAAYFGVKTPALIAGTHETGTALDYDPNSLFPVPYQSGAANFQALYSGKLLILETGSYVFGLSSDDRSDMYLDGVPLITNAFYNSGEKVASVILKSGSYDLLIAYQQGSSLYRLYATITPPGGAKVRLPNAMLRPFVSQIGTLSGTGSSMVDLPDAGSYLRINQMTNGVFAGGVTGAGGAQIEKNGEARLTLAGNNDAFFGSWYVCQGELRAGGGESGGTLGGSNVFVCLGATLVFDRSDDCIYGGQLSGKGAVIQAGSGRVTLTNVATNFSGAINLSGAGGLTLSGSNTTLSASSLSGVGRLALADGATLRVPGTSLGTPLTVGKGRLSVTDDTTLNSLSLSQSSFSVLYAGADINANYSVIAPVIAVTNGNSTVELPPNGTGTGTLRIVTLEVSAGSVLSVSGKVEVIGDLLTVIAIGEFPRGVTLVADFTAAGGLNVSGLTLSLVGCADGRLAYVNGRLYIIRDRGTSLFLP